MLTDTLWLYKTCPMCGQAFGVKVERHHAGYMLRHGVCWHCEVTSLRYREFV